MHLAVSSLTTVVIVREQLYTPTHHKHPGTLYFSPQAKQACESYANFQGRHRAAILWRK